MKLTTIFLVVAIFATWALVGCGEDGGGVYCCTYESRHTGCGGTDWTDWESESMEFNIDNYKDDWSPERVCDKYTGSWTECGGGCCINGEYRNNTLSAGACP